MNKVTFKMNYFERGKLGGKIVSVGFSIQEIVLKVQKNRALVFKEKGKLYLIVE